MIPTKSISSLVILALLLFASGSFAAMIPVDLNDFYVDLLYSDNITVAADGSWADIVEGEFQAVYLENDPFWDDPGLAVPANVSSLGFHLNFVEPEFNVDTFSAFLFDGVTGFTIDEFSKNSTWEGDVSFDLVGLDPTITLLGMVFQLDAWDFELDSSATISNLAFQTIDSQGLDPVPTPEPGTFILLGAGLAGLVFLRKKTSNS